MSRRPTQGGTGESFSRFYLSKVAISEGCGCNELVIRRRLPKLAAEPIWPVLRAAFRRIWPRKSP